MGTLSLSGTGRSSGAEETSQRHPDLGVELREWRRWWVEAVSD